MAKIEQSEAHADLMKQQDKMKKALALAPPKKEANKSSGSGFPKKTKTKIFISVLN